MLLTQDQEMIRDAVRAFAQEELWPNAARWDKEHHFPKDVHQGLAALGAYGICVPDSLGGAGLDYLSLALVLERVAARLGPQRVLRPVLAEDHRMEWMVHWQSADAPLPRSVLSPPRGQDAPGSDVPGVPRPHGSLRSFNLREPSAGYAIVSYVVDAPASNALSSVVSQLRGEGFAVDGSFGTAARAADQLILRLERPGRDLLVSAHPHGGAPDRSLLVYVTRSR